MEPEFPDLDMTLNFRSHMTLFDAKSPIGGSSSGHDGNVPTSRDDVKIHSVRNELEDIFDDM